MKTVMKVFALMAVAVSMVPSTAMAALTPVGISGSYNTDSDGVTVANYSIATAKGDTPWNYTYSRLKIRQSDSLGSFVDENTFTVKWHRLINDESGIAAWVGYANSNSREFFPFGMVYNGVVNYTDKIAFSYSHESVPTVKAYDANIMGNSLSGRYQHEIDKNLMLETNMKYARYSDNNARKTLGVALTKDFGMRYRLGLAYSYDTTDINKPYESNKRPYYMPQGQSALSIVPEVALPVGEGILVMKASKSLTSHSKTYGVGYHLDNLYVGLQYYRDDTYWSHDTSFSWSNKW